MGFYLGIDGGGTGCRAAVADAKGQIVGRGAAGPANIASDREAALQNILAATHAALAQAQALVPGGAQPDVSVGLGLAGANSAGAADWVRSALPFRHIRLETDGYAAVKGALRDRDGIVAALGTGSVFAIQRQGAIRQFGGWGLVLGDEGSGARIGRTALSRALHAQDGLVTMTPFLRGLLDRFDGPEGVVAFSITARPADFAVLAPDVAASPDPAAQDIMQDSTCDVAAMIHHLQSDGVLPVTFIGGLGQEYARRLQGRWPVRAALGTALDGALLLAHEAG